MPDTPDKLFVYGTLMVPEVVLRLLGHPLEMHTAQVKGYVRFRVKNAVYPGVVRSDPDAIVPGMLLSGLSASDWQILDDYEGSEYERISIMLDGDAGICAQIYLFKDPALLSEEPWDDRNVLSQLKELGLSD